MIVLESNAADVEKVVQRLRAALTLPAMDRVVEGASWKIYGDVVRATPKRWTGNLRRSWGVEKPQTGARLVVNDSPVMHWIEDGTANAGTGRIYPRVKKALFIALTARAAMQGWSPRLQRGIDYIIRKSVRGIRPRRLVAKERRKARITLKDAMVAFIRARIREMG